MNLKENNSLNKINKKKNNESGITLIALVVTIIVLLILAGISIGMLSGNNGILKESRNTKKETGIAQVVEKAKLDVFAQITENNGEDISKNQLKTILNKYFEGIDTLELPDDLSNSDIELKANEANGGYENIALVDIYNGQFKITGVSIVSSGKVGDYINYNPLKYVDDESKLTYVSAVGNGQTHGNGYANQTYEASSTIKWRVLNISDDVVEIISEEPILKKESADNGCLVLHGVTGYLYAEKELNNICKIFGYGYGASKDTGFTYSYGGPKDTLVSETISDSGARSLTVEDVNKFADLKTEQDLLDTFSNGLGTYGDNTYPDAAPYYPTIDTESGISLMKKSGGMKVTEYVYNKSRILDSDMQTLLFNSNYWLASRCNSYAVGAVYSSVRYIGDDNCSNVKICKTYANKSNEEISEAKKVRPVVSIRTELIGGNNNGCWQLK